jgi:hypothetical protein
MFNIVSNAPSTYFLLVSLQAESRLHIGRYKHLWMDVDIVRDRDRRSYFGYAGYIDKARDRLDCAWQLGRKGMWLSHDPDDGRDLYRVQKESYCPSASVFCHCAARGLDWKRTMQSKIVTRTDVAPVVRAFETNP